MHRDCIYLRPLTFTREESIKRIMLEEVRLEYDRERLSAWNVPNIDLVTSSRISACSYRDGRNLFAVGAVIPVPSTIDPGEGAHCPDRWFRIASEEISSRDTGFIVRLDVKDILHLLEERLQKCKKTQNTLTVPETSTIQRPRQIIVSSDWTKPIVDRMKHFSSICVTLSGVSGSGKTYSAILLSTLVSFYFHRPMYYLDCKKLQKSKSRMSEILEEIDSFFTRAVETPNCILIFDDLDVLSPNLVGGDENDVSERTHSVNPAAISQSKLISDRLSHLFKAVQLQGTNCGDGQWFLIATCASADSINPSLLKTSQAPLIHAKVPLLSAQYRSDLLMAMICKHNPMRHMEFDRSDISRDTEGFIPRDFEKLSLRALRLYRTDLTVTSLQDSFVAELANYTPIAQISNLKDQDQMNISWVNIGGLFDVKESLESIVRQPLLYRRIYSRARIQLPRGILL